MNAMKTGLSIITLLAINWTTLAVAQTASPLLPTDDYADFGPFATVAEAGTGPDGTYTIVRPDTLGQNGFLHAPVIFGPGIGGPVESMMDLLQRIASHGFVIISRQLDAGPGSPENNRRMITGLEWLIEQNTTLCVERKYVAVSNELQWKRLSERD